jgi:2,4-dienoyl-CoA reductase-like NADH-dependent reductase (Old Yellow Enzyme family)
VREAAGGRAAVWPKLNMDDGFKGGLTLDEGIQVGRWIEEDGSADALELTGGHTTKTPFYLMRGDVPIREMIANQKHWVARLGMRAVARRMLRPWKFEEAFFLESARRFREALSLPIILLGGVNRLDTMETALEEGFEFLAVGRALIRDPDLVDRMRAGELSAGRCSHCNLCMVEMERGGTRCVERGDGLET